MIGRLMIAAGLTGTLLGSAAAQTATPQQKMETCNFGADDKKLTGANYVHINFSGPADAPAHLREKLRLNGSVYRTFIQSA